jgi:hypothetical protein
MPVHDAVDRLVTHAERVIEHHYRALLPALTASVGIIRTNLERMYNSEDETYPVSATHPLHWRQQIQAIHTHVNAYAQQVRASVAHGQHMAAQEGVKDAQIKLQKSKPKAINYHFKTTPPDFDNVWSASKPGSRVYDLFDSFGSDAAK